MEQPTTQYAERDRSLIAYQTFGKGSLDIIMSLGLASNCDHIWDVPTNAQALERLASHFRVIMFDRRGTGHSDPLPLQSLPTWENWADDLLTVMDAAESRQAVVHGDRDGGIMALLFAASHPDRTLALSLGNTTACYLRGPDYSIGMNPDEAESFLTLFRNRWGTEELSKQLSPDYDSHALRMSARLLRGAATPRQAATHFRYVFDFDARPVLKSINVPTIVFHCVDQKIIPIEHGRYLARQIRRARFVELPSAAITSLFIADDRIDTVGTLVEFVTGNPADTDPNRALVTVLFCDIVESTERAYELGDRGWRELLDNFYAVIRGRLVRYGGREVDTAGDDVFMAFDRPTRAIHCAQAIRDAVEALNLRVRCGIHTGECTSIGDKLTGMAVHVGARIAAVADPNEIWVSETVKMLAMGSGIELAERGFYELKGIPERWALYAVE